MALVVGGTTVTGTQVLDATKLSGNLPALNGSSLTNLSAGKVLQIQRATLSSTTYTTGTTSTSIFSDSITCAATSSYVLAIFSTNYVMSCNDNTSNPYGNIRLKTGSASGTTRADCNLRDINSAGATNVERNFIGSLTAYWNPNSTSAVALHVCVENGTSNGRIGLFGDNSHTNATTLQLFEIGA